MAVQDMTTAEVSALVSILPLLAAAETICFEHGALGVGTMCSGLTVLLAEIIESETVPGTPEHDAVSAILDR